MNAYARRRRLGAALLALREQRGLTHAELSGRSGVSGPVISRLETAALDRMPNPNAVGKLLDVLDAPNRDAIERWADDAAARGWWDQSAWSRMGAGQRDWVIVESAAAAIHQYAGLVIPGLAQTAVYARHRAIVGGAETDADTIVAARLRRQRVIEEAEYRVVLEEPTVRRRPAPPDVMRAQFEHLIELSERPNVSLRILPVDADLGDVVAPRAPFAAVSYPDPDDPEIVIVDNVSTALLVTDVDEVSRFVQWHDALHSAALSVDDSRALLREVAKAA